MHRIKKTGFIEIFLVLALLIIMSGPVAGMDVYLRAAAINKTMPGGASVSMWGFAEESAFGEENGTITVPGPRLNVPAGDNTLTIHLDNNLTVPISIVIPGLTSAMVPVFFTDSNGRRRVKSFAAETPPGNTTAVEYTFTVKPGTYLYQSGTHQAVQVQMGLYGAMTQNASDSPLQTAYTDVSYTREAILLFSEVDPVLHVAVTDGTYGTTGPASTMGYAPKYFLVNGEADMAAVHVSLTGLLTTEKVLLRFLNAGLTTKVPVLYNAYMDLVAQDGYPLSASKSQYSLRLTAGKTMDAIYTAPAIVPGKLVLSERRGYVSVGVDNSTVDPLTILPASAP